METKLIDVVAEEYLRSFEQEQSGKNSAPTQMDKQIVGRAEKKQKWVSETLTPRTTAVLTFAQLEKSKLLEEELAQNKNTLDFYSWQDLDLLYGNQATPDKNVHAKIDRTVTTLGKCVLATTLVSPSTAQEEIVRKQQITKVLCEDAGLKENLGAALAGIKADETKRASLWSQSSPLKHRKYNSELKASFYKMLNIWSPSATAASKLQWVKRISDFSALLKSLFWFLYFLICSSMLLGYSISIGTCALSILFALWTAFYPHYKRRKPVISFLAEHMATLQTFLKSAGKINNLMMAHPKLKALCKDDLKAVRSLWAMGKKKSELGRMIRAMQGPSWKNWGYFMSPTGDLLAAYTLFKKNKGIFADAFYEIGKLDVHYSTASLILEKGDQLANRYVFSDLLSPKAKDDVVVKGARIWHPCLAREVAVANDLSLDSQKGNRLIVITGANMGGKSTYILSSGLAALLSQCLGIAPANSFSHTCFKKFITYVNPSQNLARGLSLAGSAFEVLKTHKKALDTTDGPVFAIVDEILNGVDAKMGLDVSKQILENRYKKYPNCVTLLTTHYMQLSELDRLPGVGNKHIEAIVMDKGMSIKFTYKILDGASKQNIVKQIIANMGILDEKLYLDTPINQVEHTMGGKLINVVSAEYLRSFKQKQGEMNEEVVVPLKKKKKWVSKALAPRTATMLTFTQLEKSKLLEEELGRNKNMVDFYSWQDLDLLCGNQATPDKNLHAKIDRTVTTLGKCVLATKLVSPSTSQEEIVRRQQITKVLCEDAALKENIGVALSGIKEDEGKRASLWSQSSPLKHDKYNDELSNFYYKVPLYKKKGGGERNIWVPSPTSPRKLQRLKRINDFILFLMQLIVPVVPFITMNRVLSDGLHMPPFILYGLCSFYGLMSLWTVYWYYSIRKPVISFLAEHMATLQTFLKLTGKINNLMMAHPKLKELCKDELKAVRHLWAMGKKKNELGQMIRAMQGPSWKNWGYFTSPTGELLAAYTVFKKHKSIFANAFYEIGKLDVLYSTASLILETERDQLANKYVFSDVLSPKAKDDVVVKGKRIWHPCLEGAVANDVSLDSQKGNRLIVITGANMGGKSTYILSSGLAALLSQCLGIAPAQSFSHTCFKKFVTYVNPSQNLARGLSLAGAAFEVLKTHKRVLDTTDGPVFAIIDEILNGVDAQMGLEVSRDTLKRRYKQYPNCVTLLTTHYMQLSELDRLPGVANKHVEAVVMGKGKPIEFTYKILDGASKQNIVKEIIANMGILDEIV